jgi:hypothetical protein
MSIIALIVWVLIIGACLGLFKLLLDNLPMIDGTFKQIAFALAILLAILLLLIKSGLLSGVNI